MRRKYNLQNAQEGDILQVLSIPKWGEGWLIAGENWEVVDAKPSKVVVLLISAPRHTYTLLRGSGKFFNNLGPKGF